MGTRRSMRTCKRQASARGNGCARANRWAGRADRQYRRPASPFHPQAGGCRLTWLSESHHRPHAFPRTFAGSQLGRRHLCARSRARWFDFPSGHVLSRNLVLAQLRQSSLGGRLYTGPCPRPDLRAPATLPLPALPPGAEAPIAVQMTAPTQAGHYTTVWQPRAVDGALFGDPVWVDIEVPEPQAIGRACAASLSKRSVRNL